MTLKLLHAMCKEMPKGLFIDALFDTGVTDETLLVSAYPTGTMETCLGPDLDDYLAFRRSAGASDYTDPLPQKILESAERRFEQMHASRLS